jgi:hypothetical protein
MKLHLKDQNAGDVKWANLELQNDLWRVVAKALLVQ